MNVPKNHSHKSGMMHSVWEKLTDDELHYYETDRQRFYETVSRKYGSWFSSLIHDEREMNPHQH